jgi:signal transduction histidine kinase
VLSRRLLVVQEEERRNLARELHDEIGQVLTGLSFQLASVQGHPDDNVLAEAQATVQALTNQVRQLSLELRPVVLDGYGLLAAIQWYIGRYQPRSGVTVHLRHDGSDRRYAPEVEIAAFRVVQEALTNIARHSGVTEAWVTLFGERSLLVIIHDQGQGFAPDRSTESTGLGGMRERVALLGGTFVLETAPGAGVHITAEFPLDGASGEPPAPHEAATESPSS